ncbi:MAG: 4-(cytidine 5'-diphospho)-2-C-methyl-D-erythritol kinase [Peptococcaceae bacterium]|jgi:4-diphosphocytidyl-2-C-methyl-D-erythritol kinase|nr:4-(cytidine 5'-diphospho)-2-C-methyl-D-erythritol kinase [Peptococcaceae bacterium]
MERVTVKAFAKVNMTLDVLGALPGGYHELETLFRGIRLHDLVALEKKSGGGVSLTWDAPPSWVKGGELPPDQDNLAARAAWLLQSAYPGQVGGVSIRLRKKIPLAAGLAGGSADGAAVLLGLNRLFQLGLSDAALARFAGQLGADVPFCLRPLAAVGRGRGELLEPVDAGPPLWLLLLKPPFGLSTAAVFARLDQLPAGRRPDLGQALAALRAGDFARAWSAMDNALAAAACDLRPELARWLEGLQAAAGSAGRVTLSGSGPTLAAFFPAAADARRLAARLTLSGDEITTAARDERGGTGESGPTGARGDVAGAGGRRLAARRRLPGWTVIVTRTATEADIANRMVSSDT